MSGTPSIGAGSGREAPAREAGARVVSLAEIEAVQPHESVGITQRVCRPLSKHLTRLLLARGVQAAAVSAANIAVGIAGAACLGCPEIAIALLFIPLAYFGEVLDCCDGEVARVRGTSDVTFFFADVAGHYFVTPLVVLALGVRWAAQEDAMVPLVLGALGAIFCAPTITLYRVRASIVLEEILARAARAPVAVHPLITSRAGHLAGDFGFDRPTHRYRISLGTGMTVVVSVALLGELATGFATTHAVSAATALVFPLWRAYDYATTIRSGRPARELQRILGE